MSSKVLESRKTHIFRFLNCLIVLIYITLTGEKVEPQYKTCNILVTSVYILSKQSPLTPPERWLEFVKILRIIALGLVLNLNLKNNLFKRC